MKIVDDNFDPDAHFEAWREEAEADAVPCEGCGGVRSECECRSLDYDDDGNPIDGDEDDCDWPHDEPTPNDGGDDGT